MQKPWYFRIKSLLKLKSIRASTEKRKHGCARRSAYYSISSNSDSGISGAGTPQQLFSAASGGILIRSGDMCGARRKFPKEVSSERKFSFLSDFLPALLRSARKSAVPMKVCFSRLSSAIYSISSNSDSGISGAGSSSWGTSTAWKVARIAFSTSSRISG